VAEDGALARREKRRRLAGVLGESLVPEKVDPSMHPMKETVPSATVDSGVLEPSLDELVPRQRAALVGSDTGDRVPRAVRVDDFVPRAAFILARGTLPSLGDGFVPRGVWDVVTGTLSAV
jgi:hypothetical protein